MEDQSVEKKAEQNQESFFKETVRFAAITLAIVLPIRLFIAEPFIVSGASMEPTFLNGDYLIVDRVSYDFKDPSRGDVVIFRYPKDPSKYFIKRVVGIPEDTVIISDNSITIKNKGNPDGFKLDQSYISRFGAANFTTVLPLGKYFVMGDNRPQSSDSRSWGDLPRNYIVGRAFLRLFPITSIGVLPGNHEAR